MTMVFRRGWHLVLTIAVNVVKRKRVGHKFICYSSCVALAPKIILKQVHSAKAFLGNMDSDISPAVPPRSGNTLHGTPYSVLEIPDEM